MAFKRLYYNPAVHGGAANTYNQLGQGNSFVGQVLVLPTAFRFVVQQFTWAADGYMCFGTETDGALFNCQGISTLNAGAIFSVQPADNSTPPFRMPTANEPWVVYTSEHLLTGILELYFEYHRR